ncbi:phosphotransferase [Trichonephila inaurata madagascariensis]|uniref:Phosphotransferase n=1 Tax=Trichonephila inaurata madagascariensis TaxID=2747483 RepID=A0A8X6KF93_9ARAC|nr:phosphotransferase [Trichonephila inaurata madagascariensis]
MIARIKGKQFSKRRCGHGEFCSDCPSPERISASVATILNKIKRPHTTVGVDGSVYKCHPHFHDLMEKKIEELTIPDYKFDLMLSEDGSGRGAALVAAVSERSR